MTYSRGQRALVEFIGTLALIFVGAGSILINHASGSGVGLTGIALAHGLTIAVFVSGIGHISGGHINPAVTFGALLARRISPPQAVAYLLAQFARGAPCAPRSWTFDGNRHPSAARRDGSIPFSSTTRRLRFGRVVTRPDRD